MAKIIKLSLVDNKENPLSNDEKTECSKRTIKILKKMQADGEFDGDSKTDYNGKITFEVGDRKIQCNWELVENKSDKYAEMLKSTKIIMTKDGEFSSIGEKEIKRQDDKEKILDFVKNMPKSQSTGIFLLAAYIIGYDLDHVEEIKKLKNGEPISMEILAELIVKRDELVKVIKKSKDRKKIDLLIAQMYRKEYQDTKGVHREDKNKVVVVDNPDDRDEIDYKSSIAIDVECHSENNFSEEERMVFCKLIQQKCDKAILSGENEGEITHTLESGEVITASWKINKNKDYIKNLKSICEHDISKKKKPLSVLDESYKSIKGEHALGLFLLVGLKMGYEMPYVAQAKALILGISPRDNLKKQLSDKCKEILDSITKDDREEEAADVLETILIQKYN